MNWSSPNLMQAAGWTLVHFLWQGLAIAVVFAAVIRLLRRSPANHRYLAGCVALVLMAAAPMITLSLLMPHHPARPTETPMQFEPPLVETTPALAPIIVSQPPLVVTAKPEPQSAKFSVRLETFFPWLVAGWIAGVCLFSCRLFAGWLQIRRLRQRATRAIKWSDRFAEIARKLGVSRSIILLQSALVEVPTVIGWLRPAVLLPVSCVTGLSPGQLEAVIAHELAHIRRHDYLINLFQSAVETLLFYHPAVWWVSRRIREEREHCCDDLAVAVCGDRIGYARALATLEELRPASAQLAVAASGAPLLRRIRRLAGQPERNPARAPWPVIGIVLVLILGMVAGMRSHRVYAVTQASETTIDSRAGDASSTNRIVASAVTSLSPGTESAQPTRPGSPEINLKVKFVIIPTNRIQDTSNVITTGILTYPQFRAVINAVSGRDDTQILTAPEVTTESGRQAQVRTVDVQQMVTSTGLGFGNNATVSNTLLINAATNFPLGPTLDVLANVSADAKSIQITLIPSVTEFVGYDSPSNYNISTTMDGQPNGTVTAVLPLPHFRLRQVVTNVAVWDGQTAVIGGLSTWDTGYVTNTEEVPVLGNLPVVGRLFRNGNSQGVVQKKLLVFVTATLVNPDGTLYHSDRERKELDAQPPPSNSGDHSTGVIPEPDSQDGKTPGANSPKSDSPSSQSNSTNAIWVATLVQDGKFFYEAGHYDEAEAKLKQALSLDPTNVRAKQYANLISKKRENMVAVSNPGANEYRLGRRLLIQKMESIHFDSINYAGVTLPDIIRDLCNRMRSADSDGKGVNFLFDREVPDPDKDGVDITQIKIWLNLQNVSLAETLDAITKTADHPIKYNLTDYGIYFSLRDMNEPTPFEIRTFKIDPNSFIQGLENANGGGGIGAGSGIQFVTGSDSTTVIDQAIRTFFKSAGVTLNSNTAVFFGDRKGTLTVRATAKELDLIESAIQQFEPTQQSSPSADSTQESETSSGESAAVDKSSALEIRTFRVDPNTFVLNAEKALGTNWSTNHEGSSYPANLIRAFFRASIPDLDTNAAIVFNDRRGFLTVRASKPDLDLIEAVIQTLNTSLPEITVQVKFVELPAVGANGLWLGSPTVSNTNIHYLYDTNFIRYFGSNGANAVSNAFGTFAGQEEPAVSRYNRGGLIESNIVAPVTATGILDDPQYRAVLNALEQRDGVQVLTLPSTTMECGRRAQIKSGEMRSLVVSGPNGYATTNMFFGPVLDLTANATVDGKSIELDLDPSIGEFLGYLDHAKTSTNGEPGVTDYDGNPAHMPKSAKIVPAVPVIETESLKSFVTIKDAQTVVLGGLTTDNIVTVKDKVPVLGDIPIMGRLFRSRTSQNVRKPVLVFVTATLINPDGTRYHSEK